MPNESLCADVAVVGLGAVGAAVLYQLARRGVRVVGIDRYVVPHALGSSHGETRITRRAVGEGADYVPFVSLSHRIWRELEAETGQELLRQSGNLILSGGTGAALHHGKPDFVRRSAGIAEAAGIAHEVLDGRAIRARFPHMIGVRDADTGYYEPGGGYVHPERCLVTQLSLAARYGARVVPPDEVRSIDRDGGGLAVSAASGLVIRVGEVVVAAGPWAGSLLGGLFATRLQVYRQVLHWFALDEEAVIGPDAPTFIWMHGDREEDYFYGFPPLPGHHSIKVATEQYDRPVAVERMARAVAPRESEAMYREHVAGRIANVGPCAVKSAACPYTVTPDRGFVIDRHPDEPRIFVVSACSGHGFKHSAGIGAAVAETIADGRSDVDLEPFSVRRFGDAGRGGFHREGLRA